MRKPHRTTLSESAAYPKQNFSGAKRASSHPPLSGASVGGKSLNDSASDDTAQPFNSIIHSPMNGKGK